MSHPYPHYPLAISYKLENSNPKSPCVSSAHLFKHILYTACFSESISSVFSDWFLFPGVSAADSRKLQQLKGLLSISCTALESLAVQYLCLHKGTAKLGFIATSIFAGLLQEGFCTTEEGEGKEAQPGGEGKFQEAEGTVRSFSRAAFHYRPFSMHFKFLKSFGPCQAE